jgi:hypothetical protein
MSEQLRTSETRDDDAAERVGKITDMQRVKAKWLYFEQDGKSGLGFGLGLAKWQRETGAQVLAVRSWHTPVLLPIVGLEPSAFVIEPLLLPRFQHFRASDNIRNGALIVDGTDSQFLSFEYEGKQWFVDLASGELQDKPPARPFGWFASWRLLMRGPAGEFEQVAEIASE